MITGTYIVRFTSDGNLLMHTKLVVRNEMQMHKQRIIALLGCLVFCTVLMGQAYDNTWVFGSPMSSITFQGDSAVPYQLPDTTLQSFLTVGSMCDKRGNLLFYTNGIYVYNRLGVQMPNGDSLSYPSPWYGQLGGGMSSRQGVVILPLPSDSNIYYIFHYTSTDTILAGPAGYESLNFYYSVVDMRLDSGRGDIVSKNIKLIDDELLSFSRLAACKHANGRDWWIVKNAWSRNIYYKFLLTPDGVAGPFIQQIGPGFGTGDEQPGYSLFSPDGSTYVSFTGQSSIVVMDFDRCTGLFSNPSTFFNDCSFDPVHHPISGGVSCAFSPNGRFLYITNSLALNQYDVSRRPIHDSVSIIVLNDSSDFYQMDILQEAPNGKIYVSCWAGGSYKLHVIHQPDSFGLACDFRMYDQNTFTPNTHNLPYFPNYRLAALPGSCDTIHTGIAAIEEAHPAFATITTNPANDRAVLVWYTAHGNEGRFSLYDMSGREVWHAETTANQGNLTLNLQSLAEGSYIAHFESGGEILLNEKLVVIR